MQRRAFTVIELIVVVGIIVLLIAILIPSLGAVKNRAMKTQTQALLNNLGSGIVAYHQQFNAYPGPMPASVTVGTTQVSGAQNMMLGLTYSLTSTASGMALPYPTTGARYVTLRGSVADPSGPTNWANIKMDGNPEKLSPYFTPQAAQVVNDQITPGGRTVTSAPLPLRTDLPMVVDNIPDALPVLYFRRTVGVDKMASGNLAADVGVNNPSSTPAPYYLGENRAILLASDLRSVTGASFNQKDNSALAGSAAAANADFKKILDANGSNSTSARGGFVLIAPGLDRIYGTAAGVYDDATFVGGD